MWGEGGHNHLLPPLGERQRQQRAPSGNVGATPPTAAGTEGDHNFPLPQPEEKEVVQGLGLWPAPEGHGVMGGHGVTDSPQAGYKGALQDLGLWPT